MFYLSSYVVDFIRSSFGFPTMNWKWTKQNPPIHIYYSTLWEDKCIPLIYEICDQFIGAIYPMLYKKDAPRLSE